MAQSMGQQVIVDARQGAGGELAAVEVLKAEPDGYSVLFSSSQLLAKGSTPEELGKMVAFQLELMAELAKEGGIKPQ